VLAVIGAALVLMIGGAVAYASIPAPDGTITGCVLKSSGVVRIIDTATESCKSSERTVPWNQAGQPGEDGADAPDFSTQLYRAKGGTGGVIPGGGGWQSFSYCDPDDKVMGIDGQVINGSSNTATSVQIVTDADGREGYTTVILGSGNPTGYTTPRCLDLTP
jgi:hypothetical protein